MSDKIIKEDIWEVRKNTALLKMEGVYRNIYWVIEAVTINGEKEPLKWTAGFRGTGTADSYDICKSDIKSTIDRSINYENN